MPRDFADESVLLAALREGDEAAFAWLLDRYDGPLRRLARNFVAADAVADEVVQETWLGVIRGLDRFEGRSSLKTWIYRIMLNTARSRGVREKRTVPFSSAGHEADGDEPYPVFPPERFRPKGEEWAGWWAAPPTRWEPADRFERKETVERIRRAMDGLPATQRIVMGLRDVDGWSSAEVCNVLGISQTNQRVLLHRARARVRAELDSYLTAADR